MKTRVSIIALVLLAAAVVAIKIWFFPSVKDAYFAMDRRNLQKVPAGMLVVRPTHFAFLKEKGTLGAVAPPGSKNRFWLMGRNAPLRDVIAMAYNWNAERVMLPPDASTGRFDFLMTGTSNQMTGYQTLIRHKLGYVAKVESLNADVLALKIDDSASPAFTLSRADETRRINLDGDKLHFRHVRLGIIVEVFGDLLESPAVDKTGTTNLYDFTIAWNSKADQTYNAGTMPPDKVEQIVASLGLKFEPDKAPLDMLVVKKAD